MRDTDEDRREFTATILDSVDPRDDDAAAAFLLALIALFAGSPVPPGTRIH